MKAVWYERKGAARDVLVFGDRPEPQPGPGEVRVKIVVSGINPSDIKGRTGWRGTKEMAYPLIIPHQDGAGIIDRVGPGVPASRIGERVWTYEAQRGRPFGTAAEHVVIPAEQAVRLPDGVDFAVGAALGVPALTAHRALFIDGSILGHTVLVTGGAGGVGQAAVLLAKWAGARVIATVSRPEQAEVARAAGADWVINRKSEDVAARVAAVTGGAGVDRVVDVAFEANLDANLASLKTNGVISTYAPAAEYPDIRLPFYQLFAKAVTVHLIYVYVMSRQAHEAAVRDVTAALEAGRYRPHIGLRVPLAETAAAHEAQESGRTIGKIVVDVAPARDARAMAEDPTYTEYRADFGRLRRHDGGPMRAGNFDYRAYPFIAPPELRENRVGRHKVVIVGGGLAGLVAAVDLGVRGVPCVLVDDNNMVSSGSRSIAQGKRTLEIATRLGIAERMTEKGIRWSKGNTLISDEIIYAFDLLPEGNEKYSAFLCLPQYYVETILVERAAALPGVEIRWSNRVTGVTQDDDAVHLDIATPAGNYAVAADWVIACDGVRSTVRSALGIPFAGASFVDKFVICDVKMAFNFPPQRMFWFAPTFDDSNIALMHQQPDAIWRIDWQLRVDDDPEVECAPDRVNQRLARMFGPGVPFETQFASIYAFEVRRLDKFRHGRVFFAGDAAHQLSPFGGGRGGNSAIQDADNLAWKLAHVLAGTAPARLLDSYDAERIPVADENMALSRRAAEFITPTSAHSLALRNAVLALAPRHAFAKVLINTGRLSVAPNLAGSPLVTPDEDAWETAVTPGAAAIDAPVGMSEDGDWLIHHLGGDFTLMVDVGPNEDGAPALADLIAGLGRGAVPVHAILVRADPGAAIAGAPVLHDRAGLLRRRYDLRPGSAYLFRPDQHVAARWRVLSLEGVRRAVRRSLGEPA